MAANPITSSHRNSSPSGSAATASSTPVRSASAALAQRDSRGRESDQDMDDPRVTNPAFASGLRPRDVVHGSDQSDRRSSARPAAHANAVSAGRVCGRTCLLSADARGHIAPALLKGRVERIADIVDQGVSVLDGSLGVFDERDLDLSPPAQQVVLGLDG